MVRATADNAERAKDLATQARGVAEGGSGFMADMRTAMAAIDASSAEVAKIVKNIDEIAFQTNILALNAAVEAARAGDAGAGFAVVADEVRSLAQRSAAAARETADKIDADIANSRRGAECTAQMGQALQQITDNSFSCKPSPKTDQIVGFDVLDAAGTWREASPASVITCPACGGGEGAGEGEGAAAARSCMTPLVVAWAPLVSGR
jgi:hypothetical protein